MNRPREAMASNSATALLKSLAIRRADEIDPEEIAMCLEIVTLQVPMNFAEACLFRRPKGRKSLIYVRDDIPEEGRRRFATAHEVGHFVLHEEESQGFVCTLADIQLPYNDIRLEIEANIFASELLMPQELFTRDCDRLKPGLQHIFDLARIYRTSATATGVRFAGSTDEHCAVVFSSQGKVKWLRNSRDRSLWIEPGTVIHENTYAYDCAQQRSTPDHMEPVLASAWLGDSVDPAAFLLEQSVLFPNYGVIMTLLWDETGSLGFENADDED